VEFQTISTLPEHFIGASTCAEVQMHPSGKYLYASNRGDNSIAVFGLESSGRVKLLQHQPTGGKTPRHFCLDPSSRWVLAENQDSDNVVIFRLDEATGKLAATGVTRAIGAPVCVVFTPKL